MHLFSVTTFNSETFYDRRHEKDCISKTYSNLIVKKNTFNNYKYVLFGMWLFLAILNVFNFVSYMIPCVFIGSFHAFHEKLECQESRGGKTAVHSQRMSKLLTGSIQLTTRGDDVTPPRTVHPPPLALAAEQEAQCHLRRTAAAGFGSGEDTHRRGVHHLADRYARFPSPKQNFGRASEGWMPLSLRYGRPEMKSASPPSLPGIAWQAGHERFTRQTRK